tara:strand:+ start:96 stop:317 length:222 start_codon:yes stop_codon:yes gene_type:complete
MKKNILIIFLISIVLSLLAAKNDTRDGVRHTCALWEADQIDEKETAKRLGLKSWKEDFWGVNSEYCDMYIKGE